MVSQSGVIAIGLLLAGWGHLLLHDLLGAAKVWTRADDRFPAGLRSTPGVAGRALLMVGAMLVLAPVLG